MSQFVSYKHIISLGYFCSTAIELERIGLRDYSYPFDWLVSDFKGVLHMINNHFEGFLEYESLSQSKSSTINHSVYKNTKESLTFFHDFDKFNSLESQLPSVQQKYKRRIDRFYNSISEPTLFVRYISNESQDSFGKSLELIWIEKNYEFILQSLRKFNPLNNIVFIGNKGVTSSLFTIYQVEPDENDYVARNPFNKNEELFYLFDSIPFPNRTTNIQRYEAKKAQKAKLSFRLKQKISIELQNTFRKQYIHPKQF